MTAVARKKKQTHLLAAEIDYSVDAMVDRLVCRKWALLNTLDSPWMWRQCASELHGMALAFVWTAKESPVLLSETFNYLSDLAVQRARILDDRR